MMKSPSLLASGASLVTKSRLSELALDAAIELDRASRSKEIGEAPNAQRFFQLIRDQLDQDRHRVFKDQTLVPIYARALSRSVDNHFVPRDDLAHLLGTVLKKHETVDAPNDAEAETSIAFLRDFCLAVHEALVSSLMGHRIATIKNDERARYN